MSSTTAGVLLGIHALAAAAWVGGMFFAWMAARPAAGRVLEAPARLRFWEASFGYFFPWVWASVLALLATGLWLIFGFYGGMGGAGAHVHLMLVTGLLMMAVFGHIVFAPFRRMRQAIAAGDWTEAGRRLGQIRRLVGFNLILGLFTVAVGAGGRLF